MATLNNKHRLTVVSDSQGRDLTKFLGYENHGKYNIYGFCQPGAPIQHIIQSVTGTVDFTTLTKKDCVVVVGGTNNISQQTCSNKEIFLNDITKYIERQMLVFKHTNLILSTIPYRYDLSADNSINELIRDTNIIIRKIAYSQPNVNLLDLYLLKSCHHTKHGLHINKRGKIHVSRDIIKLADAMVQGTHTYTEPHNKILPVQSPQTIPSYSKEANDSPIAVTNENINNNEVIEVIEADMTDVFFTFKNNPQAAFATCISRDFGDKRHMSAGVAVKFRKMFGRPVPSDCVSDYLSIQCFENRASVYGLLTKQRYSDKPVERDYNMAFNDLVMDFQDRKFNRLICSPLGCVRDQINPKLFVKNIIEFQRKTDAMITIVVQEERSTRTLRNGLKHQDFMDLLRSCISETQQDSLPPLANLLQFPPLPQTSHIEQPTFMGQSLSTVNSSSMVQSASLEQLPLIGQPSRTDNLSTDEQPLLINQLSTLDNLSSADQTTVKDQSSLNQVFLD